MPFKNAVLQEVSDLPAGEVIASSPFNISGYDKFQEGLIEGRFVKFNTNSVENLNGSANPVIAGIAKRKITGEIGEGLYSNTGQGIDQVAEVIDFGYATVTVTDTANPIKRAPVYVINADTDDRGKITEDSGADGALLIDSVVFWEQKAANTWLVRINKYL